MRSSVLAGLAGLAIAGAAAVPVLAQQRDPAYAAARSAGKVGEQPDGYLGIVGASDPALQRMVDDINIKRKAVWYYDPASLSEYKPAFLDMAQQRGVLTSMAPQPAFGSTYAAALFSGVQPSSVGFGEQEAFRHYLQCMLHQARGVRAATFDATVVNLQQTLNAAER